MKSHRHAGRVNLRGRKFIMLSCRCCSVEDFREDEIRKDEMKIAAEEIADRVTAERLKERGLA